MYKDYVERIIIEENDWDHNELGDAKSSPVER